MKIKLTFILIVIIFLFSSVNSYAQDDTGGTSCPENCTCDEEGETIACGVTSTPSCPQDCTCDAEGEILDCVITIMPVCPENCQCDDQGNTLECEVIGVPSCPENCACDEEGKTIACESTPTPSCPENCTCDDEGKTIACEDIAVPIPACPENCQCDYNGEVIFCETGVTSCPAACECDRHGNILDCHKTECVDSDHGKQYYVKGNVYVPHASATYDDKCAYNQAGNPDTMNDKNLLFEAYCFEDEYGYGYDYHYCPNGCEDGECIPFFGEPDKRESRDENTPKTITFCQGCQLDQHTCLPVGTRLEKKGEAYYCDVNKEMILEKENEEKCQNDYECVSNNCKGGLCSPICEGCTGENNVCLPVGTRTTTQYCNIDHSFIDQNLEEESCNNNYECASNICVNNQCVSPSLMQKIMDWFNKIF
ncbi:hypothetical protein CL622_02635 [archaeon]|nr:hypothetical protein [archaeon]